MATPYGKIDWSRHVYQSSLGGATYCPADRGGRLVTKSTPRLAKLLQEDYAELPARRVVKRFVDHHQVRYSKDLVRDLHTHLSDHLKEVEDRWTYQTAPVAVLKRVATVSVSRDGAMAHMLDGKASSPARAAGWRECMCGVICLYDDELECLHTTYVGVGPQADKPAFTYQLTREVAKLKQELQAAGTQPTYVGVADGAVTNWTQLEAITDRQVTDYFHVGERLAKLAATLKGGKSRQQAWLKEQKSRLLEQAAGADLVIDSVEELLATPQQIKSTAKQSVVRENLTYLRNQRPRMNYYDLRQDKLPIGSGPVEAGCKTLIKARLGGSGMRWLIAGADDMLISRSQVLTDGRYDQYWQKRMQYAVN